MQTCPLKANAPMSTRFTAQSRSALASTMAPALPPSSSTTGFLPARSFMRQPTAGEPVKESSLKRSSCDQSVTQLAIHGQDRHGPVGQPGLVDDLRHDQHRERVARRRLEHDGAARGDGRRDLVGREVEREVEGADARDRPDGEATRERVAAGVRRGDVEGHGLAAEPLGFLSSQAEDEHTAVGLHAGIADGLARLPADEPGQLVTSGGDAVADAPQGAGALEGGQGAHGLEAGDGGADGLLVLLLGGQERGARRAGQDGPGHRPRGGRGESTQRPAR